MESSPVMIWRLFNPRLARNVAGWGEKLDGGTAAFKKYMLRKPERVPQVALKMRVSQLLCKVPGGAEDAKQVPLP